jgi:hypothetical protein
MMKKLKKLIPTTTNGHDKPADNILAFRTITTMLAMIQQRLLISDDTLSPKSDEE